MEEDSEFWALLFLVMAFVMLFGNTIQVPCITTVLTKNLFRHYMYSLIITIDMRRRCYSRNFAPPPSLEREILHHLPLLSVLSELEIIFLHSFLAAN